jgi:xanthine dehydrogenase accessory factor
VREILDSLERWSAEGQRAALATLVKTERSALREPGAAMAVSERGDVAGSLTGGCVEPALYEEARAVLAGEPARLRTYGIADDEAFEAGLPCGGTIHVLVAQAGRDLMGQLAAAVREERPVAFVMRIAEPDIGAQELMAPDGRTEPSLEGDTFVLPLLPRPRMYVFGSVDHAAALAQAGRLLGYHVTVCDARAKFLTPERFPHADELVVGWPDEVLGSRTIDARTAICVLTHDHKLDVPALKAALATDAGYVGALGSRKTNTARAERLREEGVSDDDIARIHAPIGLDIGAKTPQEVAVAVAAEIVAARFHTRSAPDM